MPCTPPSLQMDKTTWAPPLNKFFWLHPISFAVNSQSLLGRKLLPSTVPPPSLTRYLSLVSLVNKQFITELILKSRSATCSLDTMPTLLIKSCLPMSLLLSGTVPSSLKRAAITPALKWPRSGLEDYNILEWTVLRKLQVPLSGNSLWEECLSGFRAEQTTETLQRLQTTCLWLLTRATSINFSSLTSLLLSIRSAITKSIRITRCHWYLIIVFKSHLSDSSFAIFPCVLGCHESRL